jgi:hypothetical protein
MAARSGQPARQLLGLLAESYGRGTEGKAGGRDAMKKIIGYSIEVLPGRMNYSINVFVEPNVLIPVFYLSQAAGASDKLAEHVRNNLFLVEKETR